MKWNTRNLSRHDWDFSEVQDEELEECATYEFLREVDSFREKVLEVREKEGIPDFKEAHSFFGTDTSLPPYFFPSALFFREDWPDKPYQSLPREERKEMLGPVETNIDPAWSMAKIFGLLQTADLEDDSVELCDTLCFPNHNPTRVIAAFEIDWRSSNAEIMQGIRAWLNTHRPGDVEIGETRGAGGRTRKSRANLGALGIWRILKAHGGNRTQAYTSKRFNLSQQFASPSAWTRAKKRAEELIEDFEKLSRR